MKKAVRNTLKIQRDSIDKNEREALSIQACEMIAALDEYASSRLLLLYHPFGSELDVRFLAQRAVSDGKQIAIPCMERDSIRFLIIPSFNELPEMLYDLPEEYRSKYSQVYDFSDSMCVVPALAVDYSGIRIGYGKGCYDRFLSSYEGTSVCAVFANLFVQSLPSELHDVPVDIAVIPGVGVKRFK